MKSLKMMVYGFFFSVQFFTIIPVRREFPVDEKRLKIAVLSLPVLGLLIGCLGSLLLFLLKSWTPLSDVAVTFFLFFYFIAITGGIHLDGFTDTLDAYFSYRDKEKRLEIMKDPRVGTFGVLSLIFLLSFRFLFIFETTAGNLDILFVMLIPFFSRLISCLLMILGPGMAKQEGLGYLFSNALSKKDVIVLIVYLLLLLFIFHHYTPLLLMLTVSAFFLYLVLKRFFLRTFGGLTGDAIGAAIEGSETVLWMMLWLLHLFAMD
ncbi:adenosylcobinamide-GDP ribazoletransferase [Aeribacillus pallidus]|uniref:adenosylcobinamide-GDP ribazoletransferase n=1 Tax=Aeribacillus TaxID=1055323 RepID=UPI0007B4D241|nr:MULTISPECIES: adenosylcobinamide-GDP ribazoletransferase [Aeribacillus]KZM53667.1 hypothetical protein A3Q35_16780 [Aeribacillus pallidus]MED0650327.1 adenosylcobinamide-GDP ribazoletransferase [Aeribacillus composti]MED4486480.1 adenosylcobinamide-GDP ribazoletransferase [Aeribacillus pallidus]